MTRAKSVGKVAILDRTWSLMRAEAQATAQGEPETASFMNAAILTHDGFADALSYRIAQKLADKDVGEITLREACYEAYRANPDIVEAALADIRTVHEKDPACRDLLQPLLFFKGYIAVQSYRLAHWLWGQKRRMLSLYIQSRVSELFGVDIHPAAKIGRRFFLDHASGVVIGETARVGDDVSVLHGVTLGGTGKEGGDRHPKVCDGVLIGAGAKVLGNIEVGEGSRVASGSVVVKDVPAHCTVAGIPAKPVGPCKDSPSQTMDQNFDIDPDLVLRRP